MTTPFRWRETHRMETSVKYLGVRLGRVYILTATWLFPEQGSLRASQPISHDLAKQPSGFYLFFLSTILMSDSHAPAGLCCRSQISVTGAIPISPSPPLWAQSLSEMTKFVAASVFLHSLTSFLSWSSLSLPLFQVLYFFLPESRWAQQHGQNTIT